MDILSVTNLSKNYGFAGNTTKALDDVSFHVKEKEFVAIMGASGSGKTTLLNCISTIDTPTGGNVLVEGVDITKLSRKDVAHFRREKLGFIFQDFNLLDSLNCEENIALALSIYREGGDIRGKVNEMAKLLNVEAILNKFPYQISGGEKQRIACARAMVKNPSLILADEPTGALDSRSSRILMETFQTLNQKLGAVIFMVTHDANMASFANRVLFIKDGKLFNEIYRGEGTQRVFYERILEVIGFLGGDLHDA